MSAIVDTLKWITPASVQEAAKLLLRPEYRLFAREHRRLRAMPRYRSTTTRLLGHEIEIMDGRAFLTGYGEIFQRRIYEFKAANSTPLILDCGANIGLSVIFFKRLYPSCQVIAFEPDAKIFEALQKNLRPLGLSGVELHQQAVWTSAGFVNFLVEGGDAGRIAKPEDSASLKKVAAVRLKDLLGRRVDFLKLDIEGAEADVLSDCRKELSNVEYIFVEYHSHLREKQRLDEILHILQEAGFRYHLKEAFTSANPFLHRKLNVGMDLQLNVFGYRT